MRQLRKNQNNDGVHQQRGEEHNIETKEGFECVGKRIKFYKFKLDNVTL